MRTNHKKCPKIEKINSNAIFSKINHSHLCHSSSRMTKHQQLDIVTFEVNVPDKYKHDMKTFSRNPKTKKSENFSTLASSAVIIESI